MDKSYEISQCFIKDKNEDYFNLSCSIPKTTKMHKII